MAGAFPHHSPSFLLDQQSESLGPALLEGRSLTAGHGLVGIGVPWAPSGVITD